MIGFIEKLDAYTETFLDDNYSDMTSKLFGFCELVRKRDQVFPVVINLTPDRSIVPVSLDDRYDIITWIRLPGPVQLQAVDDDLWGAKIQRRQVATLRWVIAHKVDIGESLVYELAQSVPSVLRNITGYKYSFSEITSIDPDHESVYTTELGNTVYEKHRFDWNIYAVDVDIEFIFCRPSPIPEWVLGTGIWNDEAYWSDLAVYHD